MGWRTYAHVLVILDTLHPMCLGKMHAQWSAGHARALGSDGCLLHWDQMGAFVVQICGGCNALHFVAASCSDQMGAFVVQMCGGCNALHFVAASGERPSLLMAVPKTIQWQRCVAYMPGWPMG